MARSAIDNLIISLPYDTTTKYRRYEFETRWFDLLERCRPASYVTAVLGFRSATTSVSLQKFPRSDRFAGASRRGGK
jgi:hypothetical protein